MIPAPSILVFLLVPGDAMILELFFPFRATNKCCLMLFCLCSWFAT
uniref:Uncharacterized protein n=1 Tax=Setaria italica TaxID=4555 RepID=K3Z1B5_SETIT